MHAHPDTHKSQVQITPTSRHHIHFISITIMPKSRAEIQKEYRLRKGEELKEKEKLRSQARRDAKSPESKQHEVGSRERMQRLRARRIDELNASNNEFNTPASSTTSSPYANRSSESKATFKAQRGLPNSPRKKVHVIRKLAQSHCPGLICKPKSKRNKISPALKQQAIDYYKKQDISRMAPGK